MSQNPDIIHDEYSDKKRHKVLAIFLMFLCFLGIYGTFLGFIEEYSILEQISKNAIYVGHRSFAIGAFWLVPFFIIFSYLMYLRLVNKLTIKAQIWLVKAGGIGLVSWVITCSVYGFWLDSHLRINGYTHCYWYDSPTRGSPTIWVESERFCQKRASNTRLELFNYFDQQDALNRKPTDKELNAEIKNIVENSVFYKYQNDLL
ncbi:hypothetical protein ABHN84_03835 [Shewanella vesiculosa]|uniref:DUF1240 domain-containing protein n=1 Tax=Shewanella vesiculosa TaxID=518738 RepID=A0ABV0FP71_9GAMM